MVLSFLSPIKAKHNISSSSAVYMYFVGAMSRIFRRALITAFLLLCVDCSPTLFLIMQSFSEAVDTDKYLLIRLYTNKGNILQKFWCGS